MRVNWTLDLRKGAKHLATDMTEGFCCDVRTVAHRVIEYQGKQYYSSLDMGINYHLSLAKYHMEYKWYPGFNDYPLGKDEDFDYSAVTIVREWVTGAWIDIAKEP